MIEELLYWGTIGLIFFGSVYMTFVGSLFDDDPSIDTAKKYYLENLPYLIYWFSVFLIWLIVFTLASTGMVFLIIGSWPNWFFLSKEYFIKTVIVITNATVILYVAEYYRNKIRIKTKESSTKSHLFTDVFLLSRTAVILLTVVVLLFFPSIIWLSLNKYLPHLKEYRVWYGLFICLLLAIYRKEDIKKFL